jgi:hypothetical protein
MADHRIPGLPEPTPSSDLEYDLAHDGPAHDGSGQRGSGGAAPASQPDDEDGTAARTYVATETVGYDGDYGYDLAHDVPGR